MDKTDVNLAVCLKTMNHVGFQRVHNVCTGTYVDVPWGPGDWVVATLLGSVFLGALALIISFLVIMWREAV